MSRATAFFALSGFFLCLANAGGAELFCVTAGCDIYQGYAFLGLSFYVWGALAFGAVLLFSRLPLLRERLPGGMIILCSLLLVGDALFLAYQVLFWPCTSCLAVALLLGGIGYSEWRKTTGPGRNVLGGALALWLVLLIPAGFHALKEMGGQPWILYGVQDAPTQVYFSPTCPSCKTVVESLLDNPSLTGKVAFIPVAKNTEDKKRIAGVLSQNHTGADAVRKLFQTELPPGELSLKAQLRLLRNKSSLAGRGFSSVPQILSSTVIEAPTDTTDYSTPFMQNYFAPDADSGKCGFGQEDCPDPE